MGIPIVSEILTGIQFVINFFMDKAPKPLKIIMFLMLLLLFGALIPFMLHSFGIHCTHEGDVVKTNTLSVFTNLKLAMIDPDADYNTSSYNPEPISLLGVGESCYSAICMADDGLWRRESADECINKTIIYPFVTTQFDWTKCVTCDGDENYTFIHTTGLDSSKGTLCFGDANRIEEDDMNWFQSWVCEPESRCMPPVNYYYEYDTGTFDCLDEDLCGGNLTEYIPLINEELKSANAKLLYSNNDNKNYKNFILFKCDKKLRPQMTIYGIPLFDYKVWLLLMVVSGMVFVMLRMKDHN